jgi:hypothetical protein
VPLDVPPARAGLAVAVDAMWVMVFAAYLLAVRRAAQ